jgi:mycothiol synthase
MAQKGRGVHITSFAPADASSAELDACFRLEHAATAVDRPDEPKPSRDAAIARLTRPPAADRRRLHWLARSAATGELTGIAQLMLLGEQPSDLAAFDITVHPEYRRHGVGTALLREVASAASDRHALLMEGISDGSAGQAWASAQGFRVAQRTISLTLDLATVDRACWRVPVSPGYRLACWTGSSPDELLDSYARVRNAISEAPHGDMSFTEPEWTPERVRAEEAVAHARGCELRVVVAVHESSAEVAGLTYLEVHRHRPELAIQQDTAVMAMHRGHGLGAWMKAANLTRLTADHPQVTHVRTSNAADNAHMLRVNRQVGFTAEVATEIREARVADLATRLGLTVSGVR